MPNPTESQNEESLPIIEKDGEKFLRLYYYMPAKHLWDLLGKDEIKVSLPEECNDPLEFRSATQNRSDGNRSDSQLGGGFISFSEKYDNPLMWSHYADSHKGVCLRFDFPIEQQGIINQSGLLGEHCSPPFVSIKETDSALARQFSVTNPVPRESKPIIIKVLYKYKRPIIRGGIISGSFSSGGRLERLDLSPVFYTKASEWIYEKEWRLIVTPAAVESYHNDAFFVTGLTKFVTGIFLGSRYPQRIQTTWARLLQTLKSNIHFPEQTNIINRIEMDKAMYHDTEYRIIMPRIQGQTQELPSARANSVESEQ